MADLGLGILVSLKDMFTKNADKVTKSANSMSKSAEQATGKFNRLESSLQSAAGYVVFQKAKQAFVSMVGPAVQLQEEIAKIQVNMDEGSATAQELTDGLMALSNQFASPVMDQAHSVYELVNGDIKDGTKALKAMEAVNKAAIVGNISQTQVVKGLGDVMAAFKFEAEDVPMILNKMNLANKVGKVNLAEYMAFVARAAPVAASLGVSFDTLTASISVLSNTGMRKSLVFNTMNTLMTNLMSNQDKLSGLVKANGFKNLQDMIKAKGLITVLNTIWTKSKDGAKAFEELGIQGKLLNNIMPLIGKGFENYSDIVKKVKGDTGTLNSDFEKTTNTVAFTWRQLTTVFENTKSVVGDTIATMFLPVLVQITEFTKKVFAYLKANPRFTKALGILITTLAGLGVVLGGLVAVVSALSVAFSPLVVEMLPVIAVIALLAGAAYLIYKNWSKIQPALQPTFDWISKAWKVVSNDIVALIDYLEPLLSGLADFIVAPFKAAYDTIMVVSNAISSVSKALDELSEKSESFKKFYNGAKNMVTNAIPGVGLIKGFKEYVDVRSEQMNNQGVSRLHGPSLAIRPEASKAFQGQQVPQMSTRNEFMRKNSELSTVKNPNITVAPPVVNTVVNVPKMTIGVSDVYLDKSSIGKITFETQQTQTIREGN